MNPNSPHRLLSLSQIIYSLLLKAYPRAHREAYGRAMLQLFRDQCRDAWQESRHWGLLKLWCRIVPDLARTSFAEQWAQFRHPQAIPPKIPTATRSHRPTAIFVSVAASVFVIVVTLAVIGTFLLPKTYVSRARVRVNFNYPKPTDFYALQMAMEIMHSQVVLDQTIQQLDLCQKWGQKYNHGTDLPLEQARQFLLNRLTLQPLLNAPAISVTAYSDNSQEAADIANAVVANSEKLVNLTLSQMLPASAPLDLHKRYLNELISISQVQKQVDSMHSQLQGNRDISENCPSLQQSYSSNLKWLKDLETQAQSTSALLSGEKVVEITKEASESINLETIDRAMPAPFPFKPNKAVNIFAGIVIAGFLGLILGGVAAYLSQFFRKGPPPRAVPAI